VVTNADLADAFGEVLGRPVPYVELADEQWLEGVSGAGINEVAVEHLVHLWRYLRTGGPEDPNGYRVTPTIEILGGAAPLTLRAFLGQQRDALVGAVQPTASRQTSA
jgi:hypothetical protein